MGDKWIDVGNTDSKGYGGGYGNGQYTSRVNGGGVGDSEEDLGKYLSSRPNKKKGSGSGFAGIMAGLFGKRERLGAIQRRG